MLKGNAIIGQSGGPTSVINASLAGVFSQALKSKGITGIYGMNYGIEGFMQERLFDLKKEKPAIIKGLRGTPGSALGSCRYKVKEPDFPRILEVLKKYNIRYYFMIGGNDTMDTIHRVEKHCRVNGYELCGIGVPKTVDNDLFGTDHTPGYPAAARYTALSVQQAGILARDMKRVDQFVIYQSIGRDAGWLTAAGALGKTDPESAPHILVLPERHFDPEKFMAKVKTVYDQCGWVSICVGEGVRYADGTPLSQTKVKDNFGNTELGAMGGGSAGLSLHKIITTAFPSWRGEFQITESLCMSAADRSPQQDLAEAFTLGQAAVKLADRGVTGKMVTLVRKPGKKYACSIGEADLSDVAVKAKPMPADMLTPDGFFVTQKFFDYAAPLVGEMPEYVRLKGVFVKK
jgi:6-phosphofructokinase 1